MARRKKEFTEAVSAPDAQFESIEDLELRGLPAPDRPERVFKHIRDMARLYTEEAFAGDAPCPGPGLEPQASGIGRSGGDQVAS